MSYPFGHGLSYTTFEYGDLRAEVSGSHQDGDLAVSVTCAVTNTGERAGREVVQLYVHDPVSAVSRPIHELKGFRKPHLAPGETVEVAFELGSRDLSYWSQQVGDWVLEGGSFEIAVGASSRDLRLRAAIDVPAPRPAPPLTGGSTLQEWMADPLGAELLLAAFADSSRGTPVDGDEGTMASGILADGELLEVIGNFPLARLATFPGIGVDHTVLDTLVRQHREARQAGRA